MKLPYCDKVNIAKTYSKLNGTIQGKKNLRSFTRQGHPRTLIVLNIIMT